MRHFLILIFCLGWTIIAIAEEIQEPIKDWPVGCWNCRSWGAIRLIEDGYAIDLTPESKLNNWGVWQHSGNENRVLIVWVESGMMEIIEKSGDKYLRQSAYSWGIASEIEEVKKIGE